MSLLCQKTKLKLSCWLKHFFLKSQMFTYLLIISFLLHLADLLLMLHGVSLGCAAMCQQMISFHIDGS